MELSNAEVAGLCSEFVQAGSHTTSVTLQFLLANLANCPQLQEKVHVNIVGVVGESAAEVEDVEKMEYVEAVVMETLRWHIPGYFALAYTAMQDCTLGGWHVPADAIMNLYTEGMTKDPRQEDVSRFGIGHDHLRIIAIRLVQAFQWQCIDDKPIELSEMDEFVEVMASPVRSLRKPFKVMAIPRL
ncbi:hypothetical protein SUGI_0001480 [Cryptomeria japonica]|nr:hypothetical protein SUGI_0001480 [Cryptomeria japonica]